YLDIYLEGMDGFSVAREIRRSGYKGDIVICSSDDSRALEAFQINAVNYIVKGATDYDRFREVFLNCCRKAAASVHDSITLTKDRKKRDIAISQISYFEVYNRMLVTHYTENNRPCSLETYGSLKRIEEQLTGKEFVRIHNSYLVNGKQIKLVFSDHIELISGEKLPVSRGYKKKLVEYWTSNRP
ncbi:MAG: LytR/AlgR family response regulator transcription factor, partial [Emergencia sp.]